MMGSFGLSQLSGLQIGKEAFQFTKESFSKVLNIFGGSYPKLKNWADWDVVDDDVVDNPVDNQPVVLPPRKIEIIDDTGNDSTIDNKV